MLNLTALQPENDNKSLLLSIGGYLATTAIAAASLPDLRLALAAGTLGALLPFALDHLPTAQELTGGGRMAMGFQNFAKTAAKPKEPNNIQATMRTQQAKIVEAFAQDKLPVRVAGRGIQGPQTLTYVLELQNPSKSAIDKALKMDLAIKSAIKSGPVRIYLSDEDGKLHVETPTPSPIIVYGRNMSGEGLVFPVGLTSLRKEAYLNIDVGGSPGVLFVGPSQKGKTTAMRNAAYHIAKQNTNIRFLVLALQPEDWKAFLRIPQTMSVVEDVEESLAALNWLRQEIEIRRLRKVKTPRIILIMDDLLGMLEMMGNRAQKAGSTLGLAASFGRHVGIHLLIGTQSAGEDGTGATAVTRNLTNRLIFGVASSSDAFFFTGHKNSGAEKLGRYKGDALLVQNGTLTRVATALVTDAEMLTLGNGSNPYRPWMGDSDPSNGGVRGNKTASTPYHSYSEFDLSPTESDDDDSPGTPRPHATSNRESGQNARTGTTTNYLPDSPPDRYQRAYLRELYLQSGESKNATLKLAYEVGKTPKTLKWLDSALAETISI